MAADPMILHKYLLVEYNPAGEVRPSPIPTNDSPPSRMGSKHLGRQRRSARPQRQEYPTLKWWGYACRLYPYKSLLRTARPSQRASQRESGRYAGVNRPCRKGAAVWRPVASTSIDETRGPSGLVRARPLVVGGQLCLVQVGGDSEPRRHAVTRSQPAQVRRFAANQLVIVAARIAQP